MRPTEVPSSNVLELEVSSSDLFKDVCVMVAEYRTPELSQQGRKIGVHSWPLSLNSRKTCCLLNRDENCGLVEAIRRSISSLNELSSLTIDVFVSMVPVDVTSQKRIYLETPKLKSVLVEKWKLAVVDKSTCVERVSVNMTMQALRSFLHFSQMSAWWNSTQGRSPAHVYYSISKNSSCQLPPGHLTHNFPCTEISRTGAVTVQVQSIPRMSITDLMDYVDRNYIYIFDGGGDSPYTSSASLESAQNISSASKSNDSSKRKDTNLDEYFLSYNDLRTSNCQSTSYAGEKHIKLDTGWRESPLNNFGELLESSSLKSTDTVPDGNMHSTHESRLSTLIKLQNLTDQDSQENNLTFNNKNNVNKNLKDLLENFVIKTNSENQDVSDGDDSDGDDDDEDYEDYERSILSKPSDDDLYDDLFYPQPKVTPLRGTIQEKHASIRNRSKSTSPYFACRYKKDENQNITMKSKPIAARKLALVAGTVAVFNPKTGLPMSSSPAPMKKARKISDCSSGSNHSSGGSFDVLKPTAYGLSKSAPPTTGLLGNFEESVLKGRIPVNGTVEGFRAELSASGSFCSKHITLPVKVQYFSISEDNAPSPYLGYISLRNKKLKKRKYRVPRRGTIQLTIFNPVNTVVKVFLVLYNLEDMPASTKTFLRQRMVSHRKDPKSMLEMQTVHYLVHLSFMSSQKSHIYLHSDIQTIFPQQAPDRNLLTLTDSPTNPKYTPIRLHRRHHMNCHPEREDA